MDVAAIVGLALAAAALCALLKRYHGEYALLVSVGTGLLIAAQLFSSLIPVLDEINRLMDQAGVAAEYGAILLKVAGLCFLAQFGADACRDAGESAIALKVELAGRTALLLLALPLFYQLLQTVSQLLSAVG